VTHAIPTGVLGNAIQKIIPWPGGGSLVRVVARLLPHLRDVMAGPLDTHQKLQRITDLIALELKADVCSIYIIRAGDVLELFASHGLRAEAIHVTRLQVGEGLVGEIAATQRPLNLKNAPDDPRFAFRPETGEEIYHGFCGVPLLRDHKTRGVLVVQSRRNQEFALDMIEILTTVAMLVTELVASSALVSRDEIITSGSASLEPVRVPGICFNHGIAIGRAVRLVRKAIIQNFVSDDVAAERARFDTALDRLQGNFDTLLSGTTENSASYEILETYRLFAADRGWLKKIHDRIVQGLTAEASIQAVQDETTARLSHATDLYLKERAQDFVDVSQRLIHLLLGDDGAVAELSGGTILIAQDISAADLLTYDMSFVRGIALEAGSPSSHVTIMARAMGVPVMGQCKNLLAQVEDGDVVIVDADDAQFYIDPPQELIETTEQRQFAAQAALASMPTAPHGPAISQDGVHVALNINAGLLSHLPDLNALDADGIGLYRTEVPFIALGRYPSVHEQSQIYARVMMEAGNKPVVFRTLDIGSDKKLPYLPHLPEDNPAMGWRGIRVGLDRPTLLRHQFRALMMASNGRTLRIMLPMVAAVGEVQSARRVLDLECENCARQGIPMPKEILFGVMLELPSLMWQMDELLGEVDFVSIGSNDLFQYTYGVDRGASHLQGVFDPLCHGFLKMLREIARACIAANIPLSLCGEMGGRPLEVLALLGVGITSFSMSAPALPAIKSMVCSLSVQEIRDFMHQILDIAPVQDYRAALRAFAKDHIVDLPPLPQTPPPLVG